MQLMERRKYVTHCERNLNITICGAISCYIYLSIHLYNVVNKDQPEEDLLPLCQNTKPHATEIFKLVSVCLMGATIFEN